MKNSSTSAMANAAITLVIWVRPPLLSATAVRESAPLMAKPWEKEDAMLARPRAMNSRSVSML